MREIATVAALVSTGVDYRKVEVEALEQFSKFVGYEVATEAGAIGKVEKVGLMMFDPAAFVRFTPAWGEWHPFKDLTIPDARKGEPGKPSRVKRIGKKNPIVVEIVSERPS